MPASHWNNLKSRVQVTGKNRNLLLKVQNHPLCNVFFLGKMADKYRDLSGSTADERDAITLEKMLNHMNNVQKNGLRAQKTV